MAGSSLVSSFGFGRRKAADQNGTRDEVLNDEDYLAWGKTSNTAELSSGEGNPLFALLEEEEGFEGVVEVPFGLKQVSDLHVVMRHAVAVAGDRREDLTRHPLFHPVFAGFALGFAIGLAQAHRAKHLGYRVTPAKLTRRQQELCEQWGAEVATYYVAVVDATGIFGKEADVELYGIGDHWRLLSDEHRLETFDRLKECVAAGKSAAHRWFEDDTADVPPYFLDTLIGFVEAYPDREFE
jgi:hypothetical protein